MTLEKVEYRKLIFICMYQIDHLIYCSVKCCIIVSPVPKVGFGTAGLFKDTKSSVLVALSSGYRYLFINIKLRKLFNISLSAVLTL